MASEQPVPANQITLDFADGEYDFRLPVAQIAELQTKCGDTGIGAIFARLMKGRYRDQRGEIIFNPIEAQFKYEDVTETIRLALIGGGGGVVNGERVKVGPTEALKLIQNYVYTRPLLEGWKIAAAILSAFIVGFEDKAQKKSRSGTKRAATAKDGST